MTAQIRVLCLAPVAALLLTLLTVLAPAAHATDRDCGDFSSQAQAQNYFLSKGGPSQDPDRLDADGDGIACDSLPCPCSTSQQPTTTTTTTTTSTIRQWGRVTRVVDGDTIDVRLRSGTVRRVRLLGIDTPEIYGTRECYGLAASRMTKRLLPIGTLVKLVSDPTQARVDRYGRLLRYVSKGTLDIQRRLIAKGRARVYVHRNDPFKRVRDYRMVQRYAQNHDLGLWGACY